jgi:hypothetical protein
MHNPALREEPRDRPAAPIPLQRDASILDWLESTGRLLARDSGESDYPEDEGEELNDLMAGDEGTYDLDDDDDDDMLDLE